ncbi:YMGG-like glycine zipper-containing protein [Aeoliella sp. ICT_H6.2]|uniref:YMGG-like glycine zipper-containing protein n=1 Tax=Aeoliella straminimaris TaxID=2954799 RepID=A0A9X2FF82_9BACT|nr:YMGG-like glycine zipper-containing protein [Aeoliella straminimaris]MCO6047634.1 YMGG-like glycine zipper-containing protein [Aeoliella straminimaris]
MATHRFRSSFVRQALLCTCVVAAIASPAAAQQYYYQPPPSYYHNDTREGTVTGAGLGAITGALIGGKKNWEGGALIGAGVGALTGRAIGSARDNADAQQVAVGSSVAAQANAQAVANSVSNYDLVQMTQAGLSDELIISTIRSRGGRFDMSPNGLIALKQSGVSDRVVLAAQQFGSNSVATPINPPTTVHVASPPVIVRPAPVIHYYHGPRYHYRHHHWHW